MTNTMIFWFGLELYFNCLKKIYWENNDDNSQAQAQAELEAQVLTSTTEKTRQQKKKNKGNMLIHNSKSKEEKPSIKAIHCCVAVEVCWFKLWNRVWSCDKTAAVDIAWTGAACCGVGGICWSCCELTEVCWDCCGAHKGCCDCCGADIDCWDCCGTGGGGDWRFCCIKGRCCWGCCDWWVCIWCCISWCCDPVFSYVGPEDVANGKWDPDVIPELWRGCCCLWGKW